MMAGFSYVALVTPPDKHPVYMAFFEATILVGVLLGNTLNAAIVDTLGLDVMAYISAGASILPCLIIIFSVSNTKHLKTSEEKWRWKEILGWRNLLSAFHCILKKRPGIGRLLLILTFLMYAGSFISSIGFSTTSFLYFTKQKGMTVTLYSSFLIYEEAMKGLGGSFILLAISMCKKPVDYFHLLITGYVFDISAFIIMSLPFYPVGAWIGCAMFVGHTITRAQVRALQAQLCDRDELGKMFAFDSIYQVIVNNAVSIGYRAVYSATLEVWPECSFSLCALVLLMSMVVAVFVSFLKQRHELLLKDDSNNNT